MYIGVYSQFITHPCYSRPKKNRHARTKEPTMETNSNIPFLCYLDDLRGRRDNLESGSQGLLDLLILMLKQ